MTHPIPFEALDAKVGVQGITGSGKTFTAIGLVEQLLEAGRQVIVIDPTGAYNGLRTAFPIPIFGGRYGDVEIGEDSGEIVARTIIDNDLSAIVDVSTLLKQSHAAARRFMAPFVATLKNSPPRARYLAIDEADEFMPEHATGAVAPLFGDLKWIVRRGRIEGWRVLMVTQRPQDIAKSVLTQCETMVIHQLTSPQDRKALLEWVKGTADTAEAKVVLDSMAKLKTGEAWVWSPKHHILERVAMPANRSEDRSKTPDADDAPRARLGFKDVDLGPIRAAMKAAPVASTAHPVIANPPAHDPADRVEINRLGLAVEAAEKRALHMQTAIDRMRANAQSAIEIADEYATLGFEPVEFTGFPPNQIASIGQRDKPFAVAHAPAVINHKVVEPGKIPSGCAKPLAALAVAYPGGMTEGQWAISAGYKKTGGTWGEYRRRLQRAEMIELCDGQWFATALGASSAGPVDLPPAPGPDLVRWWASKISGTPKMAEVFIGAWPGWISKNDLAGLMGMEPSGGTFGEYLRRLKRNHIVEQNATGYRLARAVMGDH